MKIIYASEKLEKECTKLDWAKKKFGGNKKLAISLLARINAIEQADTVMDIVAIPSFHFHNLSGKRKGEFAIDVKTRRDNWRLILVPLNDEEKEFDPCDIDKVAKIAKIVLIKEVSSHYE